MLIYEYEPQELGFPNWDRYGRAWVAGETTRDPDKADVFVVPCMIWELAPNGIDDRGQPDYNRVPFLEGREERHVFHCWGEIEGMCTPKGSIAFRADCTDAVWQRDPWTISWPWPVDDLMMEDPREPDYTYEFAHDLSFHGWSRLQVQDRILSSIAQRRDIKQDFRIDKRYWGTGIAAEEQQLLRKTYIQSLRGARFSISVFNRYGIIRYRVYEAMSMARCVLHVNNHCVYPFADQIQWTAFTFRINEDLPPKHVASEVAAVLKNTSDHDVQLAGAYAREMFEQYLWRDNWPQVKVPIIEERLNL